MRRICSSHQLTTPFQQPPAPGQLSSHRNWLSQCWQRRERRGRARAGIGASWRSLTKNGKTSRRLSIGCHCSTRSTTTTTHVCKKVYYACTVTSSRPFKTPFSTLFPSILHSMTQGPRWKQAIETTLAANDKSVGATSPLSFYLDTN